MPAFPALFGSLWLKMFVLLEERSLSCTASTSQKTERCLAINSHFWGKDYAQSYIYSHLYTQIPNQREVTLQGINISHLGERKIIFKSALVGDMLVPWRACSKISSDETAGCYLFVFFKNWADNVHDDHPMIYTFPVVILYTTNSGSIEKYRTHPLLPSNDWLRSQFLKFVVEWKWHERNFKNDGILPKTSSSPLKKLQYRNPKGKDRLPVPSISDRRALTLREGILPPRIMKVKYPAIFQ